MKTYYWKCEKSNGSLSEGKFSLARRVFSRIFLGESFSIIGEWKD